MIQAIEGTWIKDTYNDFGSEVYHDPGRPAVEVSLPHILNVRDTRGFNDTITLMNASGSYMSANFGNPIGVSVTYISNNPLVPFTYGSFLGSIVSEPRQIGLIRVQTVTPRQLIEPINMVRNVGVGKFWGDGIYPVQYPDQFITNVAYVDRPFILDDNLELTYIQHSASNPNIQLYFYENASISLERSFSNRKLIEEYARPKTGVTQQTQIVAPAAFGLLLRSSSLL